MVSPGAGMSCPARAVLVVTASKRSVAGQRVFSWRTDGMDRRLSHDRAGLAERLEDDQVGPLPLGQRQQGADQGQVGAAEEFADHGLAGDAAHLGGGDARVPQGHPDRGARQAEAGADVGVAQAEHVGREAAAGHDHVVSGVAAGRRERDQRQQMPL
nr:hypothetical protein GCM10020092_059590 [Actinoplanes digitatis]